MICWRRVALLSWLGFCLVALLGVALPARAATPVMSVLGPVDPSQPTPIPDNYCTAATSGDPNCQSVYLFMCPVGVQLTGWSGCAFADGQSSQPFPSWTCWASAGDLCWVMYYRDPDLDPPDHTCPDGMLCSEDLVALSWSVFACWFSAFAVRFVVRSALWQGI